MSDRPGYFNGAHFTEYIDEIKSLKRADRNREAIALLLRCVDATEAEDHLKGWGVAPWYYEQLAIIYRKEKRYADEISILERYEQQRKAPGSLPPKLAARLTKAKEATSRSRST